ncbi:MAG: NFACT RNA binding domain-containing protein [Eubacteriales bacterium]|nr:NFACT RNA binding domain-containing protein [Eubacteriales bacterium]
MAFDGITIANLKTELSAALVGGRLYKIAQPEADELLLTVKTSNGQYRLVISANASLPLLYLTKDNKPSPLTAPNFCMLLRKHIQNGRIMSITQPGLERIIDIEIEHLNELGDLCRKHIIAEFMGKHSNIIFTDSKQVILDSIKHVSAQISSVREVLPGRLYFIPKTTDKLNPLNTNYDEFMAAVLTKPMPLSKAIYTSYTGISPLIAEEICFDASMDSNKPANCLTENEAIHTCHIFENIMETVRREEFTPNMIIEQGMPKDFSSISLHMYSDKKDYESVSELIRGYYSKKEIITRIRQKSSDLRRIITNALERSYKKLDIQEKQLKDTQKRDRFRIYGELIHTYGYNIPEGSKSFEALNYYTNETITIPLDDTLSPADNAAKYFNRYNKLKRTFEAGSKLIEETREEINHLESIATSLDIATAEEDLIQLKLELIESGYIHKSKSSGSKKQKVTSKPFHYISSDGFDIYVGKNNYQNDELTFKFANGNDWWFHAKNMPGSHVLVRTNGKELPDRTYEEAASLAAYYSKGRKLDKVEVDYVIKKEVKKPAGSKPGFVVYYTNYSLMASADISDLKLINE